MPENITRRSLIKRTVAVGLGLITLTADSAASGEIQGKLKEEMARQKLGQASFYVPIENGRYRRIDLTPDNLGQFPKKELEDAYTILVSSYALI